jgi:hypothetical protein
VLAHHLPAGAATWVACGFDSAWTPEAHLAAFNADVGQLANWQRGGGQGPKPKPYPRPGDEARSKVKAAAIEAKARAFNARQAAQTPTPTGPPRGPDGRFIKKEASA